MKPTLHELISRHIIEYCGDMSTEAGDLLAEQIIKIVRDYHLVEDRDQYQGRAGKRLL